MSEATMEAVHVCTFQYQGLVYSHDAYSLAGSSAKARQYFDRYFCTGCLAVQDRNPRYHGTSYSAPILGSTPRDSEYPR